MAESDPGLFGGESTAVAEGGQPAPSLTSEDMGFGMVAPEEDAPEDPPAAAGKSDPAAAKDAGDAGDPTETETAEERDGRMRMQDYTRKTTELAEQRRAFEQQQQAFQQQQQAWLTQQQEQLQKLQTPAGEPSRSAQIRQLAADPNLTPSDRQGLGVIADMAQQLEESQQQYADLRTQLEQITPQVQQTGQAVSQLSAGQSATQLKQIAEQRKEAIDLFGQETYDQTVKVIGPLFIRDGKFQPPMNDASGEPFTVAEMIGRMSGKDIEQARAARNGNDRSRRGARQVAAARGVAPGASEGSGTQSREQAIAEMRRNDPTLT